MSELKSVHAFDVYEAYTNTGDDDAAQVYPKSEADKVIADLKSEIERLEILCANYRHDCDNLAISNEQVKRAASTLLKKMNHNKYKRCLAMARWCEEAYNRECGLNPEEMTNKEFYKQQAEFWYRWNSKWFKIAEQFKEAK